MGFRGRLNMTEALLGAGLGYQVTTDAIERQREARRAATERDIVRLSGEAARMQKEADMHLDIANQIKMGIANGTIHEDDPAQNFEVGGY